MPNPVATAAATIQTARALPEVARARLNKLIAARLANRQTTAATPTSRQSCSTVRQVRTRNIFHPSNIARMYGRKIYVSLTVRAALPLIAGDEPRGDLAQAVDIDSTRTCDVAHGKISGCKLHVLRKMLVPKRASICPRHQLLQDRAPRCFVCS